MILVGSCNDFKTVIKKKDFENIWSKLTLVLSLSYFNSLQLDTEHSAKYNNTYNEVIEFGAYFYIRYVIPKIKPTKSILRYVK